MPRANKKQSSPYSLRFTPQERAQVERDAVGMSLADYIRSRLFDNPIPKRRTRNKFPVKDHELLVQVLAEFKRSNLANNHNQIAKKVNMNPGIVTPETQKAIQNGSADIHGMYLNLMESLGVKVKDRS